MTLTAAILLAALLFAHGVGDFTPLATARMLKAKSEGGPLGPIVLHAAVHGVLIALAVLAVVRPSPKVLLLAFGVAFATHLAIDLARARIGLRATVLRDVHAGPFWWALGFDQFLHGLVIVFIALMVLA